jgi:type IV fimbrial biogenesis protein FimT
MSPKGFTLLEMLVALAVLALVGLLATPSLRDYLRDCQRAATVNAIAHAVHTARALAGSTGQSVELCATTDGRDCAEGTEWTGSLLLRTSASESGPLRVVPLSLGRSRQSLRCNREVLRFAPLVPSATTATLTVCDDRGSLAAMAVIVSRTGRPRIADRDASGRRLACP